MAGEPTTVNVALVIPNTGDLVGTWGSAAINPDLTAVDGFIGGVQTISATNAPITLTVPAGFVATPGGGPTQAQNAVLRFTGMLTGDVQVTLPMPGNMVIENLTTGAHVLSFRAVGVGEVIAIDQGDVQDIYNDGTNVRFRNLPKVGTYLDICDATVPAWITACTKPPYLLCDGSSFSAVTYPYLAAKLGSTTLPDQRGSPRYMLNLGTSRITTAGSGLDGNTRFAAKITQAYTIVNLNLPPYTPAGAVAINTNAKASQPGSKTGPGNATGTNFIYWVNAAADADLPVQATYTFNGTAQGGTSQPFGVIGTGLVSGITLIRAG